MNKYTEANNRLALALGWTEITEVGGALLGTPPDGGAGSRGQAMVPDWCGDWAHCGPLLVRCDIEWGVAGLWVGASSEPVYEAVAGHAGSDEALRFAVCEAVSEELEADQ